MTYEDGKQVACPYRRDYETLALPLSYTGKKKRSHVKEPLQVLSSKERLMGEPAHIGIPGVTEPICLGRKRGARGQRN